MIRYGFYWFLFLCSPCLVFADLKVATLHPLLSDLARNIGGEHVEVVSLLKSGGDPHHFSPSPGDMARIHDARLVLASGKHLEPYLSRLATTLRADQTILNIGEKLPDLKIEVGAIYIYSPPHSEHGIDPHWWHSVTNMQRATRYVGDTFAELDPENAIFYRKNVKAYQARLEKLKNEIEIMLAGIPASDRILVTSHAAFGYFCKDFGFRAIPIQGLGRESDPSSSYLAKAIHILKAQHVKAIFPEQISNPKVLQSMVRETDIKLGKPLIADGTSSESHEITYEEMMRYNAQAIAEALQ